MLITRYDHKYLHVKRFFLSLAATITFIGIPISGHGMNLFVNNVARAELRPSKATRLPIHPASIIPPALNAPDSDGNPSLLPQKDLEGILVYGFSCRDASDNQQQTAKKVIAGVTVENDTGYHLSSLKMMLTLYTTGHNGDDQVAAKIPFYVIPLFPGYDPPQRLDPFQSQRMHSLPLMTGLPATTLISGYYIKLLSAYGNSAGYSASWPPSEKFICACGYGDLPVVQKILKEHPSFVDQFSPYTKTFPSDAAAQNNHPAVLQYLLDHGAAVNRKNITKPGVEPWTPLVYAANRHSVPEVRLLLEHGADPRVNFSASQTLLQHEQQIASLPGERESVQILTLLKQAIKKRANTNRK